MRIALSPGHTPESPGARRGRVTEYGLSSAIIGDLVYRLDQEGHEAILIGSGPNWDQANKINESRPDFGLELHFNSHRDASMRGTEVLCSGSVKGQALARCIQAPLVSALGTIDRGVAKAYYELNKRKPLITIVKNTYCPFVVVEPLFLSNDEDFAKIDIQLISTALLKGVLEYGSTL